MKSFIIAAFIAVFCFPSIANAGLYDDLKDPNRCHSFMADYALESYADYVGGGAFDYSPLVGNADDQFTGYNDAITTGWNDVRTPPDYPTIVEFWFGVGSFYVDGIGDGACWQHYEIIPTAEERLNRDIDPRVVTIEDEIVTINAVEGGFAAWAAAKDIEIANLETEVASASHPDWSSIQNIPSTFPPSSHSHADATGSTSGFMPSAAVNKLAAIASGATANSADSYLLTRTNHTGTQSADTITDGTTNKAFTSANQSKLAAIATGATANQTDAYLLSRSNHTGTQAQSTVTNLTSDLASKFNTPSGSTSQYVRGDGSLATLPSQKAVILGATKSGAFPVAASATVASGNAVFYLTADNTSSGSAVCPNGNVYLDSLMLRAVEGTTPHSFGTPSLSNSNKTLTVPVTKLGSVLGILSVNQDAAGSVVKALVVCD